MFTLMTWEHEQSAKATRRTYLDLCACYNLAKNGGYYKAQIIDENNVILYEFK